MRSLPARPTSETAPALPRAGDDRAWVARIRAGDETAFDALFRTYYRPLCGFVVGYVRSLAQAEEIVQDVLAGVWERRATWEIHESVRSYLYALARHRALNHLRHRRIETRWQEAADSGQVPLGMGEVGGDPESRLRAHEIDVAIRRAVATLPPRCGEALALRREHHLTVPETAAALGVSVKRVEALLTRTYAVLRVALAAHR